MDMGYAEELVSHFMQVAESRDHYGLVHIHCSSGLPPVVGMVV